MNHPDRLACPSLLLAGGILLSNLCILGEAHGEPAADRPPAQATGATAVAPLRTMHYEKPALTPTAASDVSQESKPVDAACCPGQAAGGGRGAKGCPQLPLGAIPAPNGYYVQQWRTGQAAKAAMDDFVIYKHEWYLGGRVLGPYGRYHLRDIAKRLGGVPFPVILQPDASDQLNEIRRVEIVNFLAHAGYTDAALRVHVDFQAAEGLYGEEAERAFRSMMQGGARGGRGVTGGGATGGGNLGLGGGSVGGTGMGGFYP